MDTHALARFVEKYQLARQAALESYFSRGTSGLEVEWNVVNSALRPLEHVGAGPDARSFIEVLRERFIPGWAEDRNSLEVFHWMTEWVTYPYYHPVAAVWEARILEACLHNALNAAGLSFGERLYACSGNVLWPIQVSYGSIPAAWDLTKRRYLERCVDLFGNALATAGVHANVSLPEPLFSLDFLHQPRNGPSATSLVAFRNAAYIRGARVLRAFSALFAATAAGSPLHAELRDGQPVVRLTDCDSNRLAQFPNPPELDVPELYRSHADYVRISTDLVRRRVRFGNNNWTPTRARSDPASVAHIIQITTEQLHETYLRRIYGVGEQDTVEQLAQRIEMENMIARVELPMSRVEIRSDEGGHDLGLDMANLVLKQLLLARSYADPAWGASFQYLAGDLERARRNEAASAAFGLRADVEHPFTGHGLKLRELLRWTLDELRPLATALGWRDYLEPLDAQAGGGPNTSERLRTRLKPQCDSSGCVPVEALRELAEERRESVARDVEYIMQHVGDLGDEAPKLRELLGHATQSARQDLAAPFRFEPVTPLPASVASDEPTSDIVALAQRLIRIPSVTNCAVERLEEVHSSARLIASELRDAGADVQLFDRAKYPSVLAQFPGQHAAPVMLMGHFDVVPPAVDDSQFDPVIDGDYLWGRGSADMKTVVATYMIWMRDVLRRGAPYPPVNLLLVGNEENGEGEPTGTPHVLAELRDNSGYEPALCVVGERTGEKGNELWGEICPANRGVVRVEFVGRGIQEHTGMAMQGPDLGTQILAARQAVLPILQKRLTCAAPDGWKSDFRFPFISVGQPGVYNITADCGRLGLEIRPIPEDDVTALLADLTECATSLNLELHVQTREPGVACDRDNPYLQALIATVREVSGQEPVIGRKKPGTSGRFAPRGQAVIWGQTGIGPHTAAERHYIPSIRPYYDALTRFAERLKSSGDGKAGR